MKYRVGLTKNVGSDVEAWVFDLPGCWTVAPDIASIGPLLPMLIAEHLAWLRRHGETVADASPTRWKSPKESMRGGRQSSASLLTARR